MSAIVILAWHLKVKTISVLHKIVCTVSQRKFQKVMSEMQVRFVNEAHGNFYQTRTSPGIRKVFVIYLLKIKSCLDSLKYWWFIALRAFNDFSGCGISGGGDGLAGTLSVQLQQPGGVKPWPFHHLHLADVHIVKWIDSLTSFLEFKKQQI
jgi:hypothetical protein